MVQNHMLQLLCLVAMEPPASLEADAVRDEKLKVLKSLRRSTPTFGLTVRGQYRAGLRRRRPVPSYLARHRQGGERYGNLRRLKIGVANWRWAGVPFYLRTGKRLPQRFSKSSSASAACRTPSSIRAPIPSANRLVIRVQPDEGIKLWLMIKEPGPGGMRLQHVPLDMSFEKTFSALPRRL
jgi:glucose-6-phosphate 1-dehydrogenase